MPPVSLPDGVCASAGAASASRPAATNVRKPRIIEAQEKGPPRGGPWLGQEASAPCGAHALAVEAHRLAAQRDMHLDLHRLHEGGGLGLRQQLAALGRRLIGVRGDHRARLDELVDDEGRLDRTGGEHVADVHDREVRLVVAPHHHVLLGGDAGVARQVGDQAVAEAHHVAGGRSGVGGEAVVGHGLRQVAVEEGGRNAVRVHRGNGGDVHAADFRVRTEAHQLHLLRIAAGDLHLGGEEAAELRADDDLRFLRDRDVDAVRVRYRLDREHRRRAGALVGLCRMDVAEVIAVRVADQDGVDLAEARIIRAAHRASGVVQDARAVRILENHGAVQPTELAVVAAERRHLDDALGRRGRGSECGQAHAGRQCNGESVHYCLLLVDGLRSAPPSLQCRAAAQSARNRSARGPG